MKTAIRVDRLSKEYRLGSRPRFGPTLSERLAGWAHDLTRWFRRTADASVGRGQSFWALRDVSFEVSRGEIVGIIGRNGAGKSTLLKILSRIVEPTSGRAELRGRLGSLLEVGTGFHPELTGRENIYLNGSVLGMSRAEIQRHFDEIVQFAEIEHFLDTPVKRYSSGMYVRLAFAIAAHLRPEILILDEVLAVGDAQFQKKCLGKMKDVSHGGRTVLFVSHDMAAVRRLCTRGILLSNGKIVQDGPIDRVVAEYLATEGETAQWGVPIELSAAPRTAGSQKARFTQILFTGTDGGAVYSGSGMRVRLTIEARHACVADSISVILTDRSGYKLINADTITLQQSVSLAPGRNEVELLLEEVALHPGNYLLGLWLAKRPADAFDYIEAACEIEVAPAPDDPIRPECDGVVRCPFRLVSHRVG